MSQRMLPHTVCLLVQRMVFLKRELSVNTSLSVLHEVPLFSHSEYNCLLKGIDDSFGCLEESSMI